MNVALEPKETLLFLKPLQRVIECPLRITNANPEPVAFKVKTTDPKHFFSKPNQGVIQPGKAADVQVFANAMTEEELKSSSVCKAKFLIQTLLLSPEDESKPLSDLPWSGASAEGASKVHQQKLKVEFTDIPAASQSKPRPDSRFSKPLPLISLDPSERLEFHRPLTRRVGITLVVTNVYFEPIAIKVKTNNSKRYTARPNVFRLEPGTSVDISVHLLEMSEEPPLSLQCKDKVMIQSTVITPERDGMPLLGIFAATPTPPSEQDLVIREHKLIVVYLPALYLTPTVSSDTVKPDSLLTPLLSPSNNDRPSRTPSLLAMTVNRLRRASWRHSRS